MGRRVLLVMVCALAVLSAGIPTASAGVVETTARAHLGNHTWETFFSCSVVDLTFTIGPGKIDVNPEVRPECLDD